MNNTIFIVLERIVIGLYKFRLKLKKKGSVEKLKMKSVFYVRIYNSGRK